VVIDELHAFLASERGVHLGSLLKRPEIHLEKRLRRIGLSATIGDMGIAASWLRPDDPASVQCIEVPSSQAELKIQIRGITAPLIRAASAKEVPAQAEDVALREISEHLLQVMRAKGNHLVFARTRRDVEILADMLRTS
jgi:ATP-dependent Lhr-like helicase